MQWRRQSMQNLPHLLQLPAESNVVKKHDKPLSQMQDCRLLYSHNETHLPALQ